MRDQIYWNICPMENRVPLILMPSLSNLVPFMIQKIVMRLIKNHLRSSKPRHSPVLIDSFDIFTNTAYCRFKKKPFLTNSSAFIFLSLFLINYFGRMLKRHFFTCTNPFYRVTSDRIESVQKQFLPTRTQHLICHLTRLDFNN